MSFLQHCIITTSLHVVVLYHVPQRHSVPSNPRPCLCFPAPLQINFNHRLCFLILKKIFIQKMKKKQNKLNNKLKILFNHSDFLITKLTLLFYLLFIKWNKLICWNAFWSRIAFHKSIFKLKIYNEMKQRF